MTTLTNEHWDYLYKQADKKRSSSREERLDFRQQCAERAVKTLYALERFDSIENFLNYTVYLASLDRLREKTKKTKIYNVGGKNNNLPFGGPVWAYKNQIEVGMDDLEVFQKEQEEQYRDVSKEQMSSLREAIPDDTDFRVVVGIYKGYSYSEIGRQLNMSRQAVHQRVKKLIKRNTH